MVMTVPKATARGIVKGEVSLGAWVEELDVEKNEKAIVLLENARSSRDCIV